MVVYSVPMDIEQLRAAYPGWVIVRLGGRWIADRQLSATASHTIVADDIDEMAELLAATAAIL